MNIEIKTAIIGGLAGLLTSGISIVGIYYNNLYDKDKNLYNKKYENYTLIINDLEQTFDKNNILSIYESGILDYYKSNNIYNNNLNCYIIKGLNCRVNFFDDKNVTDNLTMNQEKFFNGTLNLQLENFIKRINSNYYLKIDSILYKQIILLLNNGYNINIKDYKEIIDFGDETYNLDDFVNKSNNILKSKDEIKQLLRNDLDNTNF